MGHDQELESYWEDVQAPPVKRATEQPLEQRLALAAEMYRSRQNRRSHPQGKFDKQKRWYPSADEMQECCRSIRPPSVSYPYSLMKHCRSLEHVAAMYGVTPAELRAHLRPPKPKTNPHRRLRGPTAWTKLTKDEPDEVEPGQGFRAA